MVQCVCPQSSQHALFAMCLSMHAASIVSQCCNGKVGFPSFSPQTALQEFDYTVTNLATDLRDGLRLTLVCHASWLFSDVLSCKFLMEGAVLVCKMPKWLDISNMSNVSHTLAN